MTKRQNKLRQKLRALGYRLRKLYGQELYWVADSKGQIIRVRGAGSQNPIPIEDMELVAEELEKKPLLTAVKAPEENKPNN